MASRTMSEPDIFDFKPSLVVSLWDGFTGSQVLAGEVIVRAGDITPLFQRPIEPPGRLGADLRAQSDLRRPQPPSVRIESPAEFVFGNLASGSYTISVVSPAAEPYYFPTDIPVTLPFPRPADLLWDQPPVWPGYPDIVLADPSKMLDDPGQTPAYLGQRAMATLSPTVAYPFPAGTTLLRGVVAAKGVPLNGAVVTTSPVAQPGQFPVVVVNPAGPRSAAQTLAVVHAPVIDLLDPQMVVAGGASFTLTAAGSGFAPGTVLEWNGAALPTTFLSSGSLAAQVSAAQVAGAAQVAIVALNPDGTSSNQQMLTVAAAPVIAFLDPPRVTAGNPAFTLAVRGSGFIPTAAVELNGGALATTWISSTELKAQVAAVQVAGAAQNKVVVINLGPRRQSSNAQSLAVVSTPVINFLEPSTVVAGSQDFTLSLRGSGFVRGATVKLDGAALPTQFLGAAELTAQVTAAQVASIGQASVTVSNPGGTASNAQTLAVTAAPAIISLHPCSVAAGNRAFALVVHGNGFASGSVVELNGTVLNTTFADSTQLEAHVPRSGYITGNDGAFVLFFDGVKGRSQAVSLTVSHPSFPSPKTVNATLLRGATASISVDMSS